VALTFDGDPEPDMLGQTLDGAGFIAFGAETGHFITFGDRVGPFIATGTDADSFITFGDGAGV